MTRPPKLSDQPVAYSNALRAVLAFVVLMGWVTLTTEQVAGAVLALEAVLGIFVWSAVTPVAQATARVARARKASQDETVAYLASLPTKTPAKKAAK